MGGWYRSPAYLIWVIGGLVVIVGVTVALGLSNPTDKRVIFAILPMLAVYMGGIFVMQARAARRAAIGESAQEPVPEPASGPGPPAGRAELARALAVKAIDPAARQAARRSSAGIWLSQVTYAAVLTAMILVGVGLYYGGVDETLYPFGDTGPGVPVAFLPIFAMIAFLVLRIPFTLRGSVEASNVELEPLGLELTETPRIGVRPRWGGSGLQTDVRGPSVLAGHRHGRAVRIELDASSYETRVAQRAPSFQVSGKDGRLAAAGDAPAAVRDAVAALEPAARWRGVKVEAGDDGIVVKRRGGVRTSEERRWMDDLWLAERLADAVAVP